ncbi:MAG: glycosyltransferase family 9 protein [Pseudomonadota bacterium]
MFARKAEKILIIKTGGLAGFVAAEPAFDVIRRENPKAEISLLTSEKLQRLARASAYFDQVAALPPAAESEMRKGFIKQLKTAKFARVYDLSADEDARKVYAGLGPFRPKWRSVPAPRRKRDAVSAAPVSEKFFDAAGIDMPDRKPDFSWAAAARKDSANMRPSWFGISGAFGLLLPSLDPAFRWPAENYADFARMMARNGIMPVLVGGKALHNFGDEVADRAPEIVDLTGKADHLQLAALSREAHFFVSDEAEEVHLAVGAGCAGVLIKKVGREELAPEGRHVVTLTVTDALGDASSDFVWRTLANMQLLPDGQHAMRR